jgi:hypothetical protein
MTISEEMKAKLFAAEIISDDECDRGKAREYNGKLQIVWDDGLVETVVSIRKRRVLQDHREHIAVETTDGYIYLFVVPEAN